MHDELSQYDYNRSQHDPASVDWATIDLLAEISRSWSPYNYAEDDPVRLIDPNGMDDQPKEGIERSNGP